YKLEVGAHLKPLATLRIEGTRLVRSAVKDDPGFRLQYHFKKDGKTVATVEARANPGVDIPQKEAGTYTVVLELFHPTYQPGNQQGGAFKEVSTVLPYGLERGAKPGDPIKVTVVEPPAPPAGKPALVVQCGKGGGKQQDEVVSPGFAYQLLQGTPLDGWP